MHRHNSDKHKNIPIYVVMVGHISYRADIYLTKLEFLGKMTVYMSVWLDIYLTTTIYIVTTTIYIVVFAP